MEQYYSILQQCGMFNGIQPRKYREVLSCLNATVREYPRGAHIVELGEQSHNTGVLLDGTMEEFLYDENGNQISVCRFCPGEVFGAELACTGWTAGSCRSACRKRCITCCCSSDIMQYRCRLCSVYGAKHRRCRSAGSGQAQSAWAGGLSSAVR